MTKPWLSMIPRSGLEVRLRPSAPLPRGCSYGPGEMEAEQIRFDWEMQDHDIVSSGPDYVIVKPKGRRD
jgi:hypothetical protein